MITLYTFPTPNGHKVSILFEELGLKYVARRVDLTTQEQFSMEIMEISPLAKIPAVIEDMPGGVRRRLFGSGAILMDFAQRTGRLLPSAPDRRAEALSWLMMGLTDLAPAGVYKFRFTTRAPEPIPFADEMLQAELDRCYESMDARLKTADYLADEYSIADIACFPFVAAAWRTSGPRMERYANLKRWHDAIAARPAVQRGLAVPE